jgi:hypothetical protein
MSAAAVPAVLPRILFFQLDDSLTQELLQALPRHGLLTPAEFLDSSGAGAGPALIFCSSDRKTLLQALDLGRGPGIPVIAVARCPDFAEWLDAIEAGAADYTSPPFSGRELGWILQSHARA